MQHGEKSCSLEICLVTIYVDHDEMRWFPMVSPSIKLSSRWSDRHDHHQVFYLTVSSYTQQLPWDASKRLSWHYCWHKSCWPKIMFDWSSFVIEKPLIVDLEIKDSNQVYNVLSKFITTIWSKLLTAMQVSDLNYFWTWLISQTMNNDWHNKWLDKENFPRKLTWNTKYYSQHMTLHH